MKWDSSGGSKQGKLRAALLELVVQIPVKPKHVNLNSQENIVLLRDPNRQIRLWQPLTLIFLILGIWLVLQAHSSAQDQKKALTLRQAVEMAIKANLDLMISREDIQAAQSIKNIQRSNLLPTFNSTYDYRLDDEGRSIGGLVEASRDTYTFEISATQPLFRGFELINSYRIADLGVDVAELNEKLTRLNVIFGIKNAYFTVLKNQKLVLVARDTVKNLEAQEEVAKNFYEVGMTPLNDLLQVQVRVANAKQNLIVAQNDLQIAESQFNIILRRPVNTPVQITDIQKYTSLENDIDYYLSEADKSRLDIKVADLEIEIAEKDVEVAKKDYYPALTLTGNYFRVGEDPDVSGGEGIFDEEGWSIRATASWDFWEWGRTHYGKKEKLSRLAQTRYNKEVVQDRAELEVKTAYLKVIESEKNIVTVEKALVQAKENLRINEERYKEQVATSTDVLDAQTLLTVTRTNYVNALYDFKIAKAALQRAISLEVLE
jgi:outer membrane protein TolC